MLKDLSNKELHRLENQLFNKTIDFFIDYDMNIIIQVVEFVKRWPGVPLTYANMTSREAESSLRHQDLGDAIAMVNNYPKIVVTVNEKEVPYYGLTKEEMLKDIENFALYVFIDNCEPEFIADRLEKINGKRHN